ncbi:MAG: CDP-alcohol phosphatidyltransferase family protein, partial [Catenulispora sp.]
GAGYGAQATVGLKRRVGDFLRQNRIRTHLFSGIEFEMTVFILAPLTGWLIPVTVAAAALLLLFEVWLVLKLWQHTRAFAVRMERAERDAVAPRAGTREHAYAKQPS